MHKLGEFICKHKVTIVLLTFILLIPAFIGMEITKINYDILVYLPEDIQTVEGQNVLAEDFNMGAFSVTIIDNMNSKDILNLENQIKEIDGVAKVVSIYDISGTTIPLDMLPSEVVAKVKQNDSDLMMITYEETTSAESTLNAIEQVKEITGENCQISGMSAMVLDTMDLSEVEIVIYIAIAVVLCLLILELSLDSYIVPFILLANIGIAILFNLGTNIIFGEISYITKALVAVLQLGVTTDFSIFLYHSYEMKKTKYKTKEEAMSKAINETFTSVVGSSLTTIAGFLVLCTMKLTLGMDLGLVMAKGVFLGVVCVLTVFPSLLLVFDKLIEKTKHKNLLPTFQHLNNFVIKHYKKAFIIFIILLIPAYLANSKVNVYYKLDESLPKDLDSIVANSELKEKFNIVSPEIILINKDLKTNKVNAMISEIEQVEGIDFVLSFSKLSSIGLNENMLSEEVKSIFESDKYQMILLNSVYDIATDELNDQIAIVDDIINKYDEDAILAGEGPLMKDLVNISDTDFKNVNASSIICILIIMFFVLKSFSLPILLITAIEFAIFLNMSIPYFSGLTLPFVAPIVLGTIQLGATIDYAILMTTTYLTNRKKQADKYEAMKQTLNSSVSSILVSGLCFFSATFGVGLYSKLEMISSLCTLISRGAIISMLVVIFILPSILLIFDKLICKTTSGFIRKKVNMKKNIKKASALLMLGCMSFSVLSTPVLALSKNETVYAKLNSDGSINNILVNEHLVNDANLDEIQDLTDLEDILNINGEETFTKNDTNLTWQASGNDIFYQGTTSKELPVNLSIKYYLDEEELDIEDMLGKSGTVTIKLTYENTDKHEVNINQTKTTMYTPFVVTAATIINTQNNSNISINNGKIVNNGTNNIVIGLASPGLYESLDIESLKGLDEITITYDTTKFELSSIYSIITPKIISTDDLKVFDKLDTMYDSVSALQSSINEISAGANELLEGSTTLDNGSSLIYENLKTISTKMNELETGAIAVDDGLKQVLASLNETKSLLSGNKAESISNIKTLISQNTSTIETLNNTNSKLKTTYDTYNLASLTSEEILAINPELLTVKISYESSYEANNNLITLLSANNQALNGTLSSLEGISTQVNTLINTIETYLNQIEQGAKQVADGTTALKEGVSLLTSKMQELSVGVSKLNTGVSTLSQGITTYNKEGITKLNNVVNNEVKTLEAKIKALVKLGEEYDTFTQTSSEMTSETKFIMVVNSKSVPVINNTVTKTEEEDNLWIRIKNLFK